MLRALLKTMRPKQWTKNIFVLAALVFDLKLTHLDAVLRSLAGFALFCLLSSTVYIINDIMDVEADRKHPTKCKRPIASGKLPVAVALAAAVVILAGTFLASYFLSIDFLIVAGLYFLINLLYSIWLKHIPLVDVLILASGFVLRVGAGVTLIEVQRFSPWLYVCTTLLALFIGFGKRRGEIMLLAGNTNTGGTRKVLEGYTIPFLDQLIVIVSGTTIIAYSLYTFLAENAPPNHAMMLTIPFVVYAIFRYLYLIHVKNEGGAPDELVMVDRPLQISFLLWGLSVIAAFYILR